MKKEDEIDYGKLGEYIFHMHSFELELNPEYRDMQRQKFLDQAYAQIAIAKLQHPFLSFLGL